MKTLCVTVATVILLGCSTAQLSAQFGESKPEHDDRVKQLLDKTELKYEIDKDGDFKLLFEFDGGRSQLVFVNSHTETYEGLEIREIWAVGYQPPKGDKVDAAISEQLIRANAKLKLGAWQVQKLNDTEVGVFRAMISADSGKDVLIDTMRLVGATSDQKESELLGSDDL